MAVILAAQRWKNNGHLIADCFALGYLRFEDRVLDPTFGAGVWWSVVRPERLVTSADLTFDFRELPFAARSFDAVAFDPPYVSVGGRVTTTIPGFHRRYGLSEAGRTPEAVQRDIDQGLAECARVTRRTILVKCQDYISSGTYQPGTYWTIDAALDLGLELVDRFDMIGSPRPQPAGRRQVHARRNLSTLLVFR